LGQVVELNKRFLEGYLQLKDEPKIQDLRNKVLKYNRLLRDLGLRDHQVRPSPNTLVVSKRQRKSRFRELPGPDGRHSGCYYTGFYFSWFGRLWLFQGLSSTDRYSFWRPSFLEKKPRVRPVFVVYKAVLNFIPEALAASTVKVAGRDVLGSWKVLISLGAAPLLYSLYAFMATVVMVRAGAPLKYRLWTPFIVVSALPFIGYAALKFGEAGMDVLKYDPKLG